MTDNQPVELPQFENAADELNLYSRLVEHFADTTPDEFEAATSVMEVIKQYMRSKPKRESSQPDDWKKKLRMVLLEDLAHLVSIHAIKPMKMNAEQLVNRIMLSVTCYSPTVRESVDFGALATHVASALGALQGYGHGGVAAVKSLEHVQNVLMKLYEQGRRGSDE